VTSIETRASWFVAFTVLAVMSFAFGVAFGTGLVVNLGNLIIIGALVLRDRRIARGLSTMPRPVGS
jgi:hypothetical protein